jgi:hypothetical protein
MNSTPTKVDVQLLGNGDVVLFSVSKVPDMNVNFVISDEEFVRMVSEIVIKTGRFPDSELNRLSVKVRGER